MNRLMRFAALLLTCALCLPATATAAVQAWLDRNQIASGETVQLTLQHDGRTDSDPDLAPLSQDFDILGRANGSSIQIVNGHMSAQMQWRLTLAPKHTGHLRVPPLIWDGQQSPALDLDVGGTPSGGANLPSPAASGNGHVFIDTSLDQSQPYVQAGVTLTVRLFTDQPLYQASLDLPANGDVLAQQVGKDSQGSEVRNGQRYQVVTRKYLLFPQRSGRISLDGPVLDAQVADQNSNGPFGNSPFFGGAFGNFFGNNPFGGMLNTTRPLHLHGKAIVLNVRPRPSSGNGHGWLPAQQVTLTESWQPDNVQVHAGEPVTRHLSLSAVGLTAAQLPDLSAMMPLPKGMRVYPDQAKLDTEVKNGNVVGHRDQDIALIASRPGHYYLPTMRLEWWDTIANRQRFVQLPEHTLDILPGPNGETSAPAASSDNGTDLFPASGQSVPRGGSGLARLPWAWLSLALGVLWLGTLLAWWRARRAAPAKAVAVQPAPSRPAAKVQAAEARKAFRQACRANAAAAARKHLLAWAQTTWPDAPPAGLGDLAQRLGNPGLAQLLRALDRACYAGEDWHGAALLRALETLPGTEKNSHQAATLPGLYP